MKTLVSLAAALLLMTTANGQLEFAVKTGVAPARAMGTAPLVVNRHDPRADFLFNGDKVEYSPSLGMALRYNTKHFFFEGEATYYTIRKTYAMQYIDQFALEANSQLMEDRCKAIDVPITAGVLLGGYVEVKSGFSMRYEFGQSSTITAMPNCSRTLQDAVFGWHGGIGARIGNVSAELRYQQEFSNYGQGIFVNDQELLLRNSPTQLRLLVGVWF
jgi:hypothetical protein